ncbi:hypothetical protein BZA70DRAFT_274477 [Myxozyma melibiosi]|uniref:COX assembly mitochondrial protein n=1 Tax=Myxozyma melibiosi TaxID=54550 RepID=A0ABR1F9K2_9ASCO
MTGKPVPAWVISPQDKVEVHKRQNVWARENCRSVLDAFLHCQTGRTLTIGWVCKDQKKDMVDCMVYYMQPAFQDRFMDEIIEEKKALKKASSS